MARLLLHAEGDARTGLGHLVRMVGVAGELAADHDVTLASASPHLDAVVAELAPWARGAFATRSLRPSEEAPWSRGESLGDELSRLAASTGASMLVSDGKVTFDANAFAPIRGTCLIVLVDNVVAHPDAYDTLVLPTCHADPTVVASVGAERVRTGAAWTFLHPAVKALRRSMPMAREGVFVSMGGADPRGLTARALDHLLTSGDGPIAVAVGAANRARDTLVSLARREPRVRIVSGSPASQEALARASRALCAFGITAYEAVALGTPLVVVPHEGVVDGDVTRFVASFEGRALAAATPEAAQGWPPPLMGDAPMLGGLAANLPRAFSS